jgi:hypothetical protein
MSATTESKNKKERTMHSARIKCQAVLALWTGRRRPSELCKELEVPTNLLASWQDRAMEGMLAALEPRTRPQEERGPMLESKLEKLLQSKTVLREGPIAKLTQRLTKIQQDKDAKAPN